MKKTPTTTKKPPAKAKKTAKAPPKASPKKLPPALLPGVERVRASAYELKRAVNGFAQKVFDKALSDAIRKLHNERRKSIV